MVCISSSDYVLGFIELNSVTTVLPRCQETQDTENTQTMDIGCTNTTDTTEP